MSSPAIDYTSRDFDGLKQSLLDYAKVAFPDWQPSSEGDFGVLMVELLAYTGDIMSYYVDRAQMEAYLPTATQLSSVLAIAQGLGYKPSNGVPAQATVTLQTADGGPSATVLAGTLLSTDFVDSLDQPIYFETDDTVTVLGDGLTQVVNVTEGETKNDPVTGGALTIGTATGLINQQFRLPNPKVYDDTIRVWVDEDEWISIDHLIDAEENDERFETFTDAAGYTWVVFGDGLNGAVPNLGLTISATYRVGVGAQGNVPAGAIISVVDHIDNVGIEMSDADTSTSTAATGGADPETKDQIRVNAPKAFGSQQRAVTLTDYENFALATPGVAKAKATCGTFTSVTVYIVGPDGATPSNDLLDRAELSLSEKTLAGVTVQASAPTFVPIDVGSIATPAVVTVWPTFSRTQVQFAVQTEIAEFLSFANRDLGEKLTVGQLYTVLMDLPGVRYVALPLFARSGGTGTADIQLQPYEFPKAGTVVVSSTGGIG